MTLGVTINDPELRPVPRRSAQPIETILLATDTWSETNGLTTTLQSTLAVGTQRGYAFAVLHPGLYPRLPNPFYRQYWHALPTPWQVWRFLQAAQPHADECLVPNRWLGNLPAADLSGGLLYLGGTEYVCHGSDVPGCQL
jgi:hypothetical protein